MDIALYREIKYGLFATGYLYRIREMNYIIPTLGYKRSDITLLR